MVLFLIWKNSVWFWALQARLDFLSEILIGIILNVEFSTDPLSCLLLRIKISDLFNGVSYDNRRQMAPLGLDIITSKPATKLKSWTTSSLSLQTNNGSAEIERVGVKPHVTSTLALSGNKTLVFFKRLDWLDSCQITVWDHDHIWKLLETKTVHTWPNNLASV